MGAQQPYATKVRMFAILAYIVSIVGATVAFAIGYKKITGRYVFKDATAFFWKLIIMHVGAAFKLACFFKDAKSFEVLCEIAHRMNNFQVIKSVEFLLSSCQEDEVSIIEKFIKKVRAPQQFLLLDALLVHLGRECKSKYIHMSIVIIGIVKLHLDILPSPTLLNVAQFFEIIVKRTTFPIEMNTLAELSIKCSPKCDIAAWHVLGSFVFAYRRMRPMQSMQNHPFDPCIDHHLLQTAAVHLSKCLPNIDDALSFIAASAAFVTMCRVSRYRCHFPPKVIERMKRLVDVRMLFFCMEDDLTWKSDLIMITDMLSDQMDNTGGPCVV